MESNNELQHWGIKGQKWGIRRYQNPDGSYTEEGIRRYQKKYPYQNPDGSLTEAGKTNYMKAARKNQLDYKNLSDKDLDMINNRFNKENQYKRNVEDYEKSTFKYKVKEALISRIKGNNGGGGKKKGGGGGGKKKGGGGGGNSVLTKLLVEPIKKAFEDALKENGKGSKGDSDESKDKDKDAPKNAPKNASNSNSSLSRLIGWTMNKDLDSIEKDGYAKIERKLPSLFRRIDEIETNGYSGVHKTWSNMNSSRLDDIEREGWTRHSGLYVISRSDELYHHGTKGQKWGVRRYQNVDGTLTAAGKERYGVGRRHDRDTKSGKNNDDSGLNKKVKSSKSTSLSGKEADLASRALSGQPLSDKEMSRLEAMGNEHLSANFKLSKRREQILRNNDAWSNVRDPKTFSKKDQDELEQIRSEMSKNRKAQAELDFARAKAEETKYAQEIKNEPDKDWIDPAFRKFSSKEEKAKAEEAYLERLSKEATLENESKWNREIGHIANKVSRMSMDGYEGIPRSERQKAEFDYVDTDDDFDRYDNWRPKYEQSREFRALQQERAKINEMTGRDRKHKEALAEKSGYKQEQLWQEYVKASRLYNERTKGIDAKEKAMYQKHKEKLIRNLCLDLGYEPTEKTMAFLEQWSWYD